MIDPKGIQIFQRHVRIGDPHVTSDDPDRLSILGNVFEALVAPAGDGFFQPLLAESWSLNDDARTWEFSLRTDVRFHDDKPLTAADVVRSLRRVRDEPVGGELGTSGVIAGYLQGSSIDALADDKVEIRTSEPMADFLDLLVDIPILSDRAIAALDHNEFIGTGGYRVLDQSDDEVVLLRVNTTRHHEERPAPRLTWTGIADPDARSRQLRTKNPVVAAGLSPDAAHALDKVNDVRVARSQTTVCATFMFNLLRGNGTSRALRRAMNYAVNTDVLIRDIAGGEAQPSTGPMTNLHLGHDPGFAGFPFNTDRARSELEKAGSDFTGEVVLDVPTKLPDEAQVLAARIAEYLADLGVKTTIVVHGDRPAYAEMVRSKEIHDAACFDSSPASTYRLLREKFHSGVAGPWWLGYTNVSVDRTIDEAARTVGSEARRALYRSAYRQISDDAPWLFLHNPYRLTGISHTDSLTRWQPAPGGLLLF